MNKNFLVSIDSVLKASLDELSSVDFLCDLIRGVGLYRFPNVYGDDEPYVVDGEGIMQIPIQLSKLMNFLKDKEVERFIDIGTASGLTVSLISAYLLRFNKKLKVTTVDIGRYFSCYEYIKNKLPIEYVVGDYSNLSNLSSDFCFIDGNHSYPGVSKNYEEIGKFSEICAFHDVNNPYWCMEVTKFWDDLKPRYSNCIEIFDHPNNKNTMGIGIVRRRDIL